MAHSDDNAYGKEHAAVDLGKVFGTQPGPAEASAADFGLVVSGADSGTAAAAGDISMSASPQSQLRGGADPENIGPGDVKMGMR